MISRKYGHREAVHQARHLLLWQKRDRNLKKQCSGYCLYIESPQKKNPVTGKISGKYT